MARSVRQRAALRKAQLASARKRKRFAQRRGLTKTSRKNFRKNVRKNPKKAAKLFGSAIIIGGSAGLAISKAITGTETFANSAKKGHIRRFVRKHG